LVEVADAPAKPRGRIARVRAVAVRTGIGLAVGAVLVVTFLRLVNASAVYQRLEHLNPVVAVLSGAVFLAAYVVRALRWRCLLLPRRVSVRRAAAIYQVGIFLNWLLPIRGGEIAMSLLLRRTSGVPVSESLAAVTLDKALDFVPGIGLLAVMPLVGLRFSGSLWVVLTGAMLACLAGVVFVGVALWRREKAVALLARPIEALLRGTARERVRPFIAGFADTLLALLRRPRILIVAGAYTFVAVGLDALFCLLAFRAVGVAVPVLVVLYGYTLFNLSFILPSPPGQVGSNELIGLLIFSGVFRVSRTGVGAMFLFSHPFTGVLMACSGLACLSAMSLTLRSTLSLDRRLDER
jgi:uncharacterized protein (TIRG00374 family)